MILRGHALLEGAGLYIMGLLCTLFQGSFFLDLSFHLFLILFALTRSLQGSLEEDYFHGLMDMVYVYKGSIHSLILSKIWVIWLCISCPLSILSALILSGAGQPILKLWLILMAVSLIAILITFMMNALMLGGRSLKSGLFILTFPLYVPLIVGAYWAFYGSFEGNTMLLVLGALLFYGPLCFMITNHALRAAICYK